MKKPCITPSISNTLLSSWNIPLALMSAWCRNAGMNSLQQQTTKRPGADQSSHPTFLSTAKPSCPNSKLMRSRSSSRRSSCNVSPPDSLASAKSTAACGLAVDPNGLNSYVHHVSSTPSQIQSTPPETRKWLATTRTWRGSPAKVQLSIPPPPPLGYSRMNQAISRMIILATASATSPVKLMHCSRCSGEPRARFLVSTRQQSTP